MENFVLRSDLFSLVLSQHAELQILKIACQLNRPLFSSNLETELKRGASSVSHELVTFCCLYVRRPSNPLLNNKPRSIVTHDKA